MRELKLTKVHETGMHKHADEALAEASLYLRARGELGTVISGVLESNFSEENGLEYSVMIVTDGIA